MLTEMLAMFWGWSLVGHKEEAGYNSHLVRVRHFLLYILLLVFTSEI